VLEKIINTHVLKFNNQKNKLKMKHLNKYCLLLLLISINPILSTAQLDGNFYERHVQTFQKELQSKKSSWNNTSKMATSPQHKTIYVLYMKGQQLAAFRDASSCRFEIGSIRQLFERTINNAYNDYKRQGGKVQSSDNESIRNAVRQIESICSCKEENNPNYSPNNYSQNNYNNNFGSNNNNANTSTPNTSTTTSHQNNQTFTENTFSPREQNKLLPATTNQSTSQIHGNMSADAIMAHIGKSQTPINKDPADLKVNMGIQEKQPYIEKPYNSLDEKVRELERIAALNPFSNEALSLKKQELEDRLKKLGDCSNWEKPYIAECKQYKQNITNELNTIKEREEGRKNWLKELEKNSNKENLKKEYETFADMANASDFAYKRDENGRGGYFYPLNEEFKNKYTEVNKDINEKMYTIINEVNTKYSKDGFYAVLLKNNDDNSYILAFRGTDDNTDKRQEWLQGAFTKNTPQIKAALGLVEDLKNAGLDEKTLKLTGHSLGGQLAMEAAIEHGIPAYTFNSKGISQQTRNEIDSDDKKKENINKITNLTSANDILTGGQEVISNVLEVNSASAIISPAIPEVQKVGAGAIGGGYIGYTASDKNSFTGKVGDAAKGALEGGYNAAKHGTLGNNYRGVVGKQITIQEDYHSSRSDNHEMVPFRAAIELRWQDINIITQQK